MATDIDRLVLRLEANTKNFERNMAKAQDTANKKLTAIEKRASGFSKNIGASLDVTLFSQAIGRFAKGGIQVAAGFEQSMNRVQALTNSTADEFQKLRNQALELGRATQYSASQASEAMGFLAMAGFNTNQIIGAMPDALNLAAAAQISLADTADIVSNVLTGYNRPVSELADVNDVLVKSFTSANTNLQMLGVSFKYVGPVATAAGIKFNETAAALSLLGNAGLQADMAGTGLRGAITKILSPSAEASKIIEDLGLNLTDAEGKVRDLGSILEEFAPHADNAGIFMKIFGQRAGPAMIALVNQGATKLRDFTAMLDNAGGTADRIATTQMRGLNAALRTLNSAWEDLLITAADQGGLAAMESAVRRLTAAIRYLSTNFAEILPWIERLGVVLGARLAVGVLPMATRGVIGMGAALIGMSRAAATASASTMTLGARLTAMTGPIGIILGLIGVVFLEVSRTAKSSSEHVQDLKNSLNDLHKSSANLIEVEDKIAASKEELISATQRYQDILAKTGEVAQNTAALELSSIRDRIAANEGLRDSILDGVRLKALEAEAAVRAARIISRERAREQVRQNNLAAVLDFDQYGNRNFNAAQGGPEEVEWLHSTFLEDARDRVAAGTETIADKQLLAANVHFAEAQETYKNILATIEMIEQRKPIEINTSVPTSNRSAPVDTTADVNEGPVDTIGKQRTALEESINVSRETIEAYTNVYNNFKDSLEGEVPGLSEVEAAAAAVDRALRLDAARSDAPDDLKDLAAQSAALAIDASEAESKVNDLAQAIDAESRASIEAAKAAIDLQGRADDVAERKRLQLAAAAANLQAERDAIAQSIDDERAKVAALNEGGDAYARVTKAINSRRAAAEIASRYEEQGLTVNREALEKELLLRLDAIDVTKTLSRQLSREKELRQNIAELQATSHTSVDDSLFNDIANAETLEAVKQITENLERQSTLAQRNASIAELRAKAERDLVGVGESERELIKTRLSEQERILNQQYEQEDGAKRINDLASERLKVLQTELDINKQLAGLNDQRIAAEAKAATSPALGGVDSLSELEALMEARQAALFELKSQAAQDAAEKSLGGNASLDQINQARSAAAAIESANMRATKAAETASTLKDVLTALSDANASATEALFGASIVGVSDSDVIRLQAVEAAMRRMTELKLTDDGQYGSLTGADVRSKLESAEMSRISHEREATQRKEALELLDDLRKGEELLADEKERLLGLTDSLAHVIFAQSEGAITWAEAQAQATSLIRDELEKLDPLYKRMEALAKRMGETTSQALEDVVFGAKDAGDAIKALALEFVKMTFRQTITTPLNNLIGGQASPMKGVATSAGNILSSILGAVPGFSGGGLVGGPGTGTSDSILSALSDGEFVVKSKETKKHLPLLTAINSGNYNTPKVSSPSITSPSSGGNVSVYQSISVTGLGIDDVERQLAPRFEQIRRQTISDVDSAFRNDAGFLAG